MEAIHCGSVLAGLHQPWRETQNPSPAPDEARQGNGEANEGAHTGQVGSPASLNSNQWVASSHLLYILPSLSSPWNT